MQIGGVVQQAKGQRLVGGIASFSQQFFRFFVTFFLGPFEPFRFNQLHTVGVRRGVAVSRQVALILHFIHDNVAIQSQLQCGTNTYVGERCFLVVNFVIVGAQIRIDVNFFRDLFFQLLEQFNRHIVIGHVDFTAAVAVYVRHFRRDWQVGDLIDNGLRIIPILRVALQHHTFVNDPVLQLICTVGHDIRRLRPFFTKFFYCGFWYRGDGRVNQQLIEVRNRFAQRHFKGVGIDGFYAQVGNWLFTRDDVIDIGNMAILEVTRIRGGGIRIRQTLPAIDEIFGGNRRTVRPFRIFTQMEGPDFKIFVVPFFRHARSRVAVYVSHQQTFKQIAVNVRLWNTFNFVRIKRLHFRTVITYQRLLLSQLNTSRNVRSHCSVARD